MPKKKAPQNFNEAYQIAKQRLHGLLAQAGVPVLFTDFDIRQVERIEDEENWVSCILTVTVHLESAPSGRKRHRQPDSLVIEDLMKAQKALATSPKNHAAPLIALEGDTRFQVNDSKVKWETWFTYRDPNPYKRNQS